MEKEKASDWLLERYKILTYRWVGKRLEGEHRQLAEHLVQAGLRVSAGMFLGLAISSATLAFAGVGLLATGLLLMLAGPAIALTYGLAVAFCAGLGTGAAFFLAMRSRVQNRRLAIDRELPFSLSELSVLASIGLSPIVLIRRMASRKHDPAMTAQFRHVVASVDTEGRDLVTALAQAARQSPSDSLRSTFWDMANIVHQGGDLEAFLRGQSETVLDVVRESQKSFTEQLGTYADMYITIVLMGIMFLAVGSFLIDAFQTTAGPLTANGLLLLLTYGLMPLVVIVLGIMLSTAYGKVA
jgi:flagellar protein FlaJ